ncbi:bifunctional uridylyltransferase/uridylyl-removing protein [Pasteurellaceae bacterium Macca]|nr:bifunctional uridylyltransferase/uridylyl-removing protein [Pasteurellaceae bacterium Macca]
MNADLLKAELAHFNAQQKSDFPHHDVHQLILQRSQFYDGLLLKLWQTFGFDQRSDLALIAVGGYGRREMFPLSDLDILVLCENPLDEQTHTQLNQLFNLLWDCKLQLGSAIRTLDECLSVGKEELSVATNLFESRLITGNKSLWQQLMERLYQADFWAISDFFTAKMAEKASRYARYHNTSYNLEPDLKHSPGGLRDLHLMQWIILRQYGVYSVEQIFEKGLLSPEEYHELKHAQGLLFQMRFALHLQLKRYDNRLRFDRQLQLSEQLGYTGEGNQPVEKMMKAFFQATQSISQLSQLVLESFQQTQLNALQNKAEKRPLDDGFYLRGNTLHCENPQQFARQPHRILDLFFHLTQFEGVKIALSTLRPLRFALKSLAQPLCEFPLARQRFLAIFQQPKMVERAIIPMHQLGVLTAYLPQWKNIVGLMQFDLFHLYTVDEHSIRVMQKIEQFLEPTSRERYPLCSQLFPKMENKHLLYLSALFHDIAKGREGDHAQNGAVDMAEFAQLHGFSPDQQAFMAWLVAEHLTLSITAQRRDIHDPDIVKTFAHTVGDATHLEALMCLTVADICATNENLWNDWKRSLFTKLYQFTLQQLRLGQEVRLDYQQLGKNHKAEALEQLKLILSPAQHQQLQQFWQPCPESYFVRNSPTQLLWHALHYLKKPELPMVLISNQYARGATEIFVHCGDQPQLFARIAHTLSQKKVSIHDAQIITGENGLVFDSFIITESNGQPLNTVRSQQIQHDLDHRLRTQAPFTFRPKPRKPQPFHYPTRLRWIPHFHPNQSAFEVFTLDREGLLAHISHFFQQQKLNLIDAKITTIGERVEDFFVLQHQNGMPLTEEEKAQLSTALIAELDR